MPVIDPWRRHRVSVPAVAYGHGAHHDFAWYFQRESTVGISTLEGLQKWILECTYVRDADLFERPDVWQHPCDFEHTRKGDCEDFALWTWRKLAELGYEAELIAGRYAHVASSTGGHVWVVFRARAELYLCDPVIRDPDIMIRPLSESRHEYLPECSIDARLNRYVYGGYAFQVCQQSRPVRRKLATVFSSLGARVRRIARPVTSLIRY